MKEVIEETISEQFEVNHQSGGISELISRWLVGEVEKKGVIGLPIL